MHKEVINLLEDLACQAKSVSGLTDQLSMTLTVDWSVELQIKQSQRFVCFVRGLNTESS